MHIKTAFDSDLVVEADPALLDRALGNVVDNAIKYGAGGGEITLSTSRGADGWVDLAVSDRGPGIPEEQLANLFDRFYRGDMDRHKARGFGLGLPIAKAIIESHEGSIDVWSEPGRGTTVTFRLQGHA